MFGRQRGGWSRARPGLTLVELIGAIAVLGVLGCLVLSRQGGVLRSEVPPPVPEMVSCPAEPEAAQEELSLQETLDRLGYTVNVPASYRGHTLDPLGYRRSTLDDTVDAAWFRSSGTVSMQLISQQTDLDAATRFTVQSPVAGELAAFWPVAPCGFNESPELLTWETHAPVRFMLDFPPDGGRSEAAYSTPESNSQGTVQLMVLPARKNGYWVEQDGESGYWAGGEETGEYLLCWEDRAARWDGDFQDLVFVARGIQPSLGPAPDGELPGCCNQP